MERMTQAAEIELSGFWAHIDDAYQSLGKLLFLHDGSFSKEYTKALREALDSLNDIRDLR